MVSPALSWPPARIAPSVFFAVANAVPSWASSPCLASAYQVAPPPVAGGTSGTLPSNTGQGNVTPAGGNCELPPPGGSPPSGAAPVPASGAGLPPFLPPQAATSTTKRSDDAFIASG